MYILALSLCSLLAAVEVKDKEKHVYVLKDVESKPISETIMINEEKILNTFPASGTILSTEIRIDQAPPNHTSICSVVPHDVKLYYLPDTPLKIHFMKSLENSFELSINFTKPIVTAMAHVEGGFFVTTSNKEILGYIFSRDDERSFYRPRKVVAESFAQYFMKIDPTEVPGTTFKPKLAYNPQTGYAYIIGRHQIVYFEFNLTQEYVGDFSKVDVQIDEVVDVASSQHYLLVATKKQVLIYEIDPENGSLKPWKPITPEQLYGADKNADFRDIAIGGRHGEYLYILDYSNGITNVLIERNRAQVNTQLGLIAIVGGTKMDQYLDESLVVLIDLQGGSHRQYTVIDLSIDIYKGLWMKLNEYTYFGIARDIDIAQSIAVIQGIDSHRIIFHSRYDKFVKNERTDVTFLASKIIDLDFFEPHYGKRHTTNWHYNQSHKIIFGVSQDHIVYYPWEEVQPHIRCYTEDEQNLNEEFKYTFLSNVTSCSDKSTLGDVISRDLFVCEKIQEVTLKVEGVFLGGTQRRVQLIALFVLMIGIFFVLVALLVWKYYNFQSERQQKEFEMKRLTEEGTSAKQSTPEQGKFVIGD